MAATAPAEIASMRSSRRRRARRFASAISGSSEKGKSGTCSVIAPVSLAPTHPVKDWLRGHSGTLAQRGERSPDSSGPMTITALAAYNEHVRRALATVSLVLCAGLVAGCGGSHAAQMGNLIETGPRLSLHSDSRHYSVHQVELAFDLRGLPLRNVSPQAYSGRLALLDGRPSHPVYVYVEVGKFSGALNPAIRDANVTHHGNVEVPWRHGEKSAVRAALRELN
jgi:hypothetical protein